MEALTVLFEASALFARAATGVTLGCSNCTDFAHWRVDTLGCDLGAKSRRVAFESTGNGLLARALVLDVVVAVHAIAIPAVNSAGKALAVELEASRVLAVAASAPIVRAIA